MTNSNESLLKVVNLQKQYAQGPMVLKGVDVDIKPGEFIGIIGLSGAGKSTFLRCINRLIDPTAGQILVPREIFMPDHPGDEILDINTLKGSHLRHIRRRIGMIFQQFNIVKRLTVIDNVLSGCLGAHSPWMTSFRMFSKEEVERALVNLERVGLLDQAYKRADALSGGQQQRVAIARVLMQRPAMILADEPVASLDPKLSRVVLDILKRVCDEDGITALVSLHTLELTRLYSNRVIGFQGGRILYDGIPDGLHDELVEQIYTRESDEESPSGEPKRTPAASR